MSDRDDDRHEPDELDPDAPASEEEVLASQRLRDALESARGAGASFPADASPEVELALSLRAAWDPETLSADESRALLDATPSADEQALAAALRDALARKHEPRVGDPEGAHLARALRAAFSPAALDAASHQAIIDVALAKMPAGGRVIAIGSRRARVVRIAFGVVTGGLALAASIVLVVTTHAPEAPLARARTTQPLFSEPFRPGETSARIDRIASARASDFRDNRFTKWGVR